MVLHRLTLRVGLPFVLLVLLVSVALALFLSAHADAHESARMRRVGVTTSSLIETLSLDTGERLAAHLERTNGYEVFFRHLHFVFPPAPAALAELDLPSVPADEVPRRGAGHEVLAVPIPGKHDLLLVRPVDAEWLARPVVAAIGAVLLVAMLTAWLVGRDLVLPLRHLARQMPRLEQPGPLDLPEARRRDEIGDLARALLRTRRALHDEQHARQNAEKLAVLGRMTAALAHEVQNPVAAIRMHAQLWRTAGDGGHAAAARTIEHEAGRIEGLLNQWLYLTRPEPPVLADLDVGALLGCIVAGHEAQARHAAVDVVLDAEHGLVVRADGRRLEQAFRNLLVNAIQAMSAGGRLVIRASRDADRLRVSFADTGPGFSPVALQRYGEFFFSEREGGMGIGLSVAVEILEAHGGRLHAANGDRGGAVVTVEFAAGDARPAPTRSQVQAS